MQRLQLDLELAHLDLRGLKALKLLLLELHGLPDLLPRFLELLLADGLQLFHHTIIRVQRGLAFLEGQFRLEIRLQAFAHGH